VFPATLFDFNGVLVDDELVHLAAFRDAVAPLGIEITDDEYFEKYLGFDDAGAFEALLRSAGLPAPAEEIARLIEAKRPLYMRRAREELKTFPGAADAVRTRARSGPVAVVSGALTEEIEFGLEQLGVRPLVERIISAEDTSVSKPDPEGYLKGIGWLKERLGAEAQRALVFEDSLDGIVAAKKAQLPCVAVAHSYPEDQLRSAGADAVFARLDLVTEELLEQLYQRVYG
jgi:HAD superfamily hydrolase (TIGR01509 family)